MEFHISRKIRTKLDLNDLLFSFTGNVVFANVAASRKLAQGLNTLEGATLPPEKTVNAGALFAMGLIDELAHALVARYRTEIDPACLSEAIQHFASQLEPAAVDKLLLEFTQQFPNVAIFRGEMTAQQWLAGSTDGLPNREAAFEELMLLWLANSNPAFTPFHVLFEDEELKEQTAYTAVTTALPEFFEERPPVAPGLGSLVEVLRAPFLASPDSLTGQLEFIREHWSEHIGTDLRRVLLAIDVVREEEIAVWMRFHPPAPGQYRDPTTGGAPEGFVGDEYMGFDEEYITQPDGTRRRRYAVDYQAPLNEYEAFSADQAWMPTVVLIAKSTYVWLEQLSKKYGRHIHRLDQIPDAELQLLAARGMTGLWLIGLWERSKASQTIKRLRGNADAVASAYSLRDYSIAEDLGGEAAYRDLRDRAARAGLRLASDMVPNHMGIDSTWVEDHPEWFLSRPESPFPSYSFEGPDLSTDSRVEIKIEDHYYDQTDAAVVFRLRHHHDGTTRFVYHGNDGTTFAWNDTAQLDYSKAQVREHVMQVILDVARRFPIIRFDAAMVLAKRHVQRLWFPLPGAGGSIPSRAEDAMSQEQFDAIMPHEFWREVVDRVAVEVPGTLLLAEAFWLLESYFVRTLGMHRVYNSAFMNMLRDEENAKYRSYLKKTVEFDPDILKRYVNFMSNPDEKTATEQFGTGDKFFGTSVLLATLPGLPMFGHGQVEGYSERYGMDFKQARMDEWPNEALVARHQQLIAPLLKDRHVFAESANFTLYDFWTEHGTVDENVFAYSNRSGDQRAIVFYNNAYHSTRGTVHSSVGFLDKSSAALQQRSLAEGLALPWDNSIIAYRDVVDGLEYLRRSTDFHQNGLTLSLRGYQHVVLLNWRVLYSTASHPWDRLCDSLHGAGVYNVEESLSRMRLQPLSDALRSALNSHFIQIFADLATGDALPAPVSETVAPGLRQAVAAVEETVELPSTEDEETGETLAPALEEFLLRAGSFAGTMREFAPGEEKPSDVSESFTTEQATPAVLAVSSLELPERVAELPANLQRAAAVVLPSAQAASSRERTWSPVLAWIIFGALPADLRTRAVFEELQMKSALAEAFSALGIEHETAWRVAAQVKILLYFHSVPLGEAIAWAEFWADSDVRWLTGLHDSGGTTYLNKEQYEELLCSLALPSLLQPDEDGPEGLSEQLSAMTGAANSAGYELKALLTLLQPAKKTLQEEPAKMETTASR